MTDDNNVSQVVDSSQTISNKVNWEDVERYLQFFAAVEDLWQSEVHCYCWMQEKGAITGYGVKFSSYEELFESYHALKFSYGVDSLPNPHITLNLTKHTGRKKKDIEATRVFCLDIDRVLTREELLTTIKAGVPSLVVESSPGKYHFYWKCAAGVGLEEWSLVQAGLASWFEGDIQLSGITHLIRVPGFPRVCKDGTIWTPRVILDDGEHKPMPVDAELLSEGKAALEVLSKERKEVAKGTRGLVNGRFNEKEWQEKAAQIGEVGKRNEALYGAVHAFVLHGGEDRAGSDLEPQAHAFGTRLNDSFKVPLGDDEAGTCIASAISRGSEARRKKARVLAEKDAANAAKLGEIREEIAEAREAGQAYDYDYSKGALASNRFSDKATVERVLQRFGERLVKAGKVLYAFNDNTCTWNSENENPGTVSGYVETTLAEVKYDSQFIPELCSTRKGGFSEDLWKKETNRLLSHGAYRNCLSDVLISGEVRRGEASLFDASPYKILCANGVLDMVTGELRQPCAADYLLHNTRVNWNADARWDWWEEFLAEVFAQNEGTDLMVTLLKQVFGYSLTGSIGEQKIFIHYGEGSNGKSKILEALALISGSYSARMGGSTLSKSKNAIQKELDRHGAKIEGKRCILVDDVDSKTQWNEGLVKNFTSPSIPSRRLYEEERDIPNRAKFHIGCNEAPTPESENFGILRRLCIIPYKRQFSPSSAAEARIASRMQEFKEGILRWAVEGIRPALVSGTSISYPGEVESSVEDYRHEHFTTEGKLEVVFGDIGTVWAEEDLEWKSMHEIVEIVGSRVDLNEVHLGRVLKNKFRFENKRVREEGHINKTTYYKIPKICKKINRLSEL